MNLRRRGMYETSQRINRPGAEEAAAATMRMSFIDRSHGIR